MIAFFMFFFIGLGPLLLTIALAGPGRPADKRHLAEIQIKLPFNKTI